VCPFWSQFAFSQASGNRANQSNFGNLNRNSFRGPFFFSGDLSLNKNFRVTEQVTFALGATAFNVLNHPNFDNPHANVASAGTFGQLFQTVSVPNSPYGNFTGAIVNGRVVQVDAKFKF
jgi:hypothetical protein